MVFKKIRVKKGTFIDLQTFRELDTRLVNNEKSNKVMLSAIIVVGILFASIFAWCIKLQVSEVKDSSSYDDIDTAINNISISDKDSKVISCYYVLPNLTITNKNHLMPSQIHSNLCTHINAGFAQIKDKEIYLDESQQQIISEIVNMKKANPNLKVLLSVGGAGGQNGFSDMVRNHTSRKIFIKSIKDTLRNLSLDGIDLDWEFPAWYQNKISKRERQHFSQLLREIRMEFIREKRNYLLTVAVAAPQIIADAAYDVDQINMYVDFANLMTYDYHTYTKLTPQTGLNSPLYARPGEQLYMATLNINYTVEMYRRKGLERSKIVVGIPTFGHSFTAVNSVKVGSPASGFGNLGQLGFVNYPDACTFLEAFKDDTTVVEDSGAKVPYMYRGLEWVSYDDRQSVIEKAKYIRNNKLRGAMIYSLNADDYVGKCNKFSASAQFPLSASVKDTLESARSLQY